MPRIFHPGTFGFTRQDVRVETAVTSGGRALSGFEDTMAPDGGGYVIAEYSDGTMIDARVNKAWRALTTGLDGGAASIVVRLCDTRHQPRKTGSVPHSDDTPFSDEAEYAGVGTTAAAVGAAVLRATSLTASFIGGEALEGGEWFSIAHALWGERAYNIMSVIPNGDNFDIEFRPPLREAIAAGTALNFDDPRCTMRGRAGGNPLQGGRIGTAAVLFVEDMRKPADA